MLTTKNRSISFLIALLIEIFLSSFYLLISLTMLFLGSFDLFTNLPITIMSSMLLTHYTFFQLVHYPGKDMIF